MSALHTWDSSILYHDCFAQAIRIITEMESTFHRIFYIFANFEIKISKCGLHILRDGGLRRWTDRYISALHTEGIFHE